MRASLIQHLFTMVLPMPRPPGSKVKCFWTEQEIRHETQADILRLLSMLSRHYAASCLSLKVTRSFDATRILTFAAIAAIARIPVCPRGF